MAISPMRNHLDTAIPVRFEVIALIHVAVMMTFETATVFCGVGRDGEGCTRRYSDYGGEKQVSHGFDPLLEWTHTNSNKNAAFHDYKKDKEWRFSRLRMALRSLM